jgi:Tfp pilus assembly protein PilO
MKPKLIIAGIASALAVTALWFFTLWSPQSVSLQQAKADQLASETRATELRNRLTHLKNLEANAEVLERDRIRLEAAIPDTDQLDKFILAVNERAASSGVSFVSISPTEPAAAAPGAPGLAGAPLGIGLQLQITGDYFAIMRFLETLRDGERLVTVENLTMSKGADGAPMTASIAGKMFVSSPVVAATATPVPPSQTAS